MAPQPERHQGMSVPRPKEGFQEFPVLSDEEERAAIKEAMEAEEWHEDQDLLEHPSFDDPDDLDGELEDDEPEE